MRLRGFLGTLGTIALIILASNIIFGGIATKYVVEYWGPSLKHAPVHVPFIPCAIAGIFVGEFTVPGAVITWVYSLAK